MSIKIKGELDAGNLVLRLADYLFGTVSSTLIAGGLGFIGFGKLDVAVYFIQTVLLGEQAQPPGQQMGWQDWLGILLCTFGLLIKARFWLCSMRKELRAEKLKFKNNFNCLTDAEIQDGMDHLYGIKNANTSHCKKIFNHPSNVDGTVSLYRFCRYHIENDGVWFKAKSKYLKLRATVGFFVWLLIPLYALLCIGFAVIEYANPGILNSGPNAALVLALMAAANLVGAALIYSDLKKMNTAITFINEYKP